MTNSLQVFNYEEQRVRTYTDENGEVWLVAKDVCDILGISKYRDAIADLDEDERMSINVDTPGGMQYMTGVSEPGFYKLTFKSRKEGAKKFTRWVTHEVLPSIRKTGSYTAPEAKQDTQELNPVNIRAAEILQKLANMLTTKTDQQKIVREAIKLVTGNELPEKKAKPAKEPKQHTPRSWTAEQVGRLIKWTADAVMHRAEDLEMTKKARYGWWDGGIWHFTKEGKQRFLDLVWKNVVRIKNGYEYYENGFKLIHWEFDPDAARF